MSGANNSGKSTLLQAIAGRLSPLQGHMQVRTGLCYLDQHFTLLKRPIRTRKLGAFLFSSDGNRPANAFGGNWTKTRASRAGGGHLEWRRKESRDAGHKP
ncbi:MAG: hypothetical protein G5701_03550 [Serratia symbiotica]|nr:hypothetical protein [Serratia symbiotica]